MRSHFAAILLLLVYTALQLCGAHVQSGESDAFPGASSSGGPEFTEIHVSGKPGLTERPTIIHDTYGIIGTCPSCTPSDSGLWRVVCPYDLDKPFTILMNLHLHEGAYLQVKNKRFYGQTNDFIVRAFNKRSILIGLVERDGEGGASFQLGFVCAGDVKHATRVLYNQDVLDYIKDNDGSFQDAAQFVQDVSTATEGKASSHIVRLAALAYPRPSYTYLTQPTTIGENS